MKINQNNIFTIGFTKLNFFLLEGNFFFRKKERIQ